MKIDDLLNELGALNLPSDSYIIVGSGQLVVREMREPNDLDILVNDAL